MKIKKYIIFLFLILILYVGSKYVFATSSDYIDATIKLSVCGDGVIEGFEDCEGTDLNDETCFSLGYVSGTLSCDASCEFDETECVLTESEDTSEDTDDNDEDGGDGDSGEGEPTSLEDQDIQKIIENILELPESIINLDPNKDGKIDLEELYITMGSWVGEWRKYLSGDTQETCDLNEDKVCDLVDFSILMSYVGK